MYMRQLRDLLHQFSHYLGSRCEEKSAATADSAPLATALAQQLKSLVCLRRFKNH